MLKNNKFMIRLDLLKMKKKIKFLKMSLLKSLVIKIINFKICGKKIN